MKRVVNGNIRKEWTRNDLKVKIVVFEECKKCKESQEMNFKTQNEINTEILTTFILKV